MAAVWPWGWGRAAWQSWPFLPEEERDEVIRYNLPRLKDFHHYDEVMLRAEIDNVRSLGYAGRNTGVLDGMAGLAVPILDRNGHAVAALSVATISDRLGPEPHANRGGAAQARGGGDWRTGQPV
ncbi:IclR family transcriptional regulator [Pseudomonas putida S11]|nr:IclR family transcriptional regulator [Pseudomonas putida S11]